MAEAQRIVVNLGERSYPVLIGAGVLDAIGGECQALGLGPRMIVVSQPPVAVKYGDRVVGSLREAGFDPSLVVVPDGEESKSFAQVTRLWDACVEAGLDRSSSAVVALGGGVVGDLAGFVAATYMRGVAFVQVPTSLLAQVDASVGGKVGINHPRAKNLIGAFHQPCLVVIDPEVLRTLPRREFVAGLAEAIKCGAVLDAELFAYLEGHMAAILALEPSALTHTIARAVRLKADIVEKDEREVTGLRRVLNFGHTIGHAIEAASGYGIYLHGEAVAIGMVGAGRLSRRLTGFSEPDLVRLTALLRKAGLATGLVQGRPEPLMAAMGHDKKGQGGRLTFVLLEGIGHARVLAGVGLAPVRRVLDQLEEGSNAPEARR